jgi:hypothetical protein
MLTIQCVRDRTVVFMISGLQDTDGVNELRQVVDAEPSGVVLVLDLTDLVLADRDAVHVLREYEVSGHVVASQPSCVRQDVDGGQERLALEQL